MALTALLLLYALLLAFGGVEGYVAKQSVPSLIAGLGFAIITLAGVFLSKNNPKIAYILCAIVCLAVLGRFLPSYLKSHAVWPALTMTIASVIVLVALIVAHLGSSKAAA